LIVTTGGTGLGPRDNTPEATRRVIKREAPGISETIRAESLKVTPMAMISRGVAGVASGTLIINLPGSPKAVRESFAVIKPVLAHSVDLLAGHTRH
jgi:molybdenum cofactor synthesis domain-containing protein